MNRIDAIETQIIEHFKKMKHNVYVAHQDEAWEAMITTCQSVEVSGEMVFGWSAPFTDDTSETREALLIYPKRIVEISEHLDDEHFGYFLDAVEFRLNLKFASVGSEQFYNVDDVLEEKAPDALELFNEVRMRALDDHCRNT